MRLNTLKPAAGEKKSPTRVGRGIGSGLGKTCGRGHKGQTSRSGYSRKVAFEGGQMPIHKRLPKFGFKSLQNETVAEVRLHQLTKVTAKVIDLKALQDAKIIGHKVEKVRIILSGELKQPVELSGANIVVTKGARAAIEKMGGKIV